MTDKEFPRKGSEYQASDVAFSVEISPLTYDNIDATKKYSPIMFRGEWYDLPITVTEGFMPGGVPSAETTRGIIPDKNLTTFAGAQALRWQFLALVGIQEPGQNWDTRIILHKIVTTYKDTLEEVVAE